MPRELPQRLASLSQEVLERSESFVPSPTHKGLRLTAISSRAQTAWPFTAKSICAAGGTLSSATQTLTGHEVVKRVHELSSFAAIGDAFTCLLSIRG